MGELPDELLDLHGYGTIADLVPLHDENRLIATLGLERLRRTNRLGLKELIKLSGGDIGEANEETVGFQLAPRLNAVGRIEQADPAVHLLMSEDSFEAEELAAEIDQLNKERQKMVSKMTDEAIEMVEQQGLDQTAIVVAKAGWSRESSGLWLQSLWTASTDRPLFLVLMKKRESLRVRPEASEDLIYLRAFLNAEIFFLISAAIQWLRG